MTDPNARLIKQNEKLKEEIKSLRARLAHRKQDYDALLKCMRQEDKDKLSSLRRLNQDLANARAEKQQALGLYHDLCARIYDRLNMVVKEP